MNRGLVLGILIAVGSLSLVVSGFQGPPAGPSAAALSATKIQSAVRQREGQPAGRLRRTEEVGWLRSNNYFIGE
ncbi:MAG: hypothetical protein DMG12_25095 [Acidobacteria bacterium]|nr:MAG: hypothetical protein DMG12_25095 [Acidobacteriota bacterium]